MKTKQIKQITQFLSAYPKDVVELGIEAWRTGELPEIQGMVTDTPLAQNYNELTEEAGIHRIQNDRFRIKCGMTRKEKETLK